MLETRFQHVFFVVGWDKNKTYSGTPGPHFKTTGLQQQFLCTGNDHTPSSTVSRQFRVFKILNSRWAFEYIYHYTERHEQSG